jgi:uncharacterized protein (TIGR00251 family)
MGQANEENYFFWDEDTLVVNILGRPGATKDAIGTPKGRQLKVSVTASPQQGRATDHMLRFLAPLFGVRERDIELVFGRESVHKQIRIKCPQKWPKVFGDWPGQPSGTTKVGQ